MERLQEALKRYWRHRVEWILGSGMNQHEPCHLGLCVRMSRTPLQHTHAVADKDYLFRTCVLDDIIEIAGRRHYGVVGFGDVVGLPVAQQVECVHVEAVAQVGHCFPPLCEIAPNTVKQNQGRRLGPPLALHMKEVAVTCLQPMRA